MAQSKVYRLPLVSGVAQPLTDGLKAGAALVDTVPSDATVSLAGLERFRVYLLTTCAGTLTVTYYRAGGTDALHTLHVETAAVVANVEISISVAAHYGEHAARVRFVPGANGVVTWSEICGVAPSWR